MKPREVNTHKKLIFALYFRQFMLINNKQKFSSIELMSLSKELNRNLNLKLSSIQSVTSLLSSYGIKDVLNKHSHSTRNVYWFYKPLCFNTFKVPNI